MAMLLKVYVTDTMLPSITIHNFINVALFLIELLIYLEDVVEFVKKNTFHTKCVGISYSAICCMAKALQIPVQIVLLFMFNLSCGGVPVSRCLALAVRWSCKARVNIVAFYQTDE